MNTMMINTNYQANRRKAEQTGRDAEAFVAASWVERGFDILARRLRTPHGEIDLVVADAETLVFIEVKARKSILEAAYAIQPRQQYRLLSAADIVMAEHNEWHRPATRFDVALVCNGAINHIEDAIRPN